jgi:hypothetical protein
LLEKASFHRERGDVLRHQAEASNAAVKEQARLEVDAYQRILANFADESVAGSSARDVAFKRIDELIASEGRAIYAREDDEVGRRVKSALTAADPDALLRALADFPNSSAVGEYTLALGDLLLKKQRYDDLFTRLHPFLRDHADAPEVARVAGLLAQGALALGNRALAESLVSYVERTGSGGDLRAQLKLAGATPAAPSAGLELKEGRVEIDFGDVTDVHFQTVGGEAPPPNSESLMLVMRDGLLGAIDVKASLASGSNTELWNLRVSDAFRPPHMWAYYGGGRLVVAYDDMIMGLDPRTGAAQWRREIPYKLDRAELVGGLLYVVTIMAAERRSILTVIEPCTGATFFQRDLKDESVTEDLEVSGGVLAIAFGRSAEVRLYDVISGAVIQEHVEHPSLSPRMAAFDDFGLLIVPKRDRVAPPAARVTQEDTLIAIDTRTGKEVAWTRTFPRSTIKGSPFRFRNYVGVLLDAVKSELWLLDPHDGTSPFAPIEFPERANRLDPLGDPQSELPILVFAPPPKGEKVSRLRAIDPTRENPIVWETPLELESGNLGPQSVGRVGLQLALAVDLIPMGGGGNETLLFILDAANGRQIARLQFMSDQYFKNSEMQVAGNVIGLIKPERLHAISLR